MFLVVTFVLWKRNSKPKRHARKVPPKVQKPVSGKCQYRTWSPEDMDGALHELAEQHAVNTKTCKPRKDCKSLRQIATEWRVPHVTLSRCNSNPGLFESGTRPGTKLVLSQEDEASIVDTILKHANNGMCLNHAQVRC